MNKTLTNKEMEVIENGLKYMIGGYLTKREINDCWALMGPANKKQRQALMLSLTGEKRPLAKCGVNAIVKEWSNLLGCPNSAMYVEKALKEVRERIGNSKRNDWMFRQDMAIGL